MPGSFKEGWRSSPITKIGFTLRVRASLNLRVTSTRAQGHYRIDASCATARDIARLAFCGAVAGMAVATGVTRYLQSVLYGVRAADPLTFASIVLLLVFVALFACSSSDLI